jgi:anti-sigma B factor antagonist
MVERTSQEIPTAPYPSQLEIARRTEPYGVRLIVRGEIDIASVPTLDQELRNAEGPVRRIVLDLAGLAFIDSAGIHMLMGAQRRAEINGHEFVLAHVPAHARRLFSLTGIDAVLTIKE